MSKLCKKKLMHLCWTSWERGAPRTIILLPVRSNPVLPSTRVVNLKRCLCKHPVRCYGYRSYATSTSDQSWREKVKGLPLLVLFGLGALGFVWYAKKKSEEDDGNPIITALKKELLKAKKAQVRLDFQGAEDHYHRALEITSDPQIKDEQEGLEARAVTLDMLANMYLEAKKWIEAENTFRETMRVMLRAGAAKDSDAFVEISLKLARVYHNQSRYEVAEAGFDWCLNTMREKCEQELTEDRMALLGMCLMCRATYYSYVGRHSEAIRDYTEQTEIAKKLHGKDSIEVAIAYSNLAVAMDAAKDTERALHLIQTSLDMTRALLKEASDQEEQDKLTLNMATFYINLATIHSNNGKYSLALEMYNEADSIAQKYQNEDIKMQVKEGREICNSKQTNRAS